MILTPTQARALDYIARHRQKEPKVGPKLSRRILNKLKKLGLVMEYHDIIMLTAEGQRHYAKLRRNGKEQIN